MHPVIGVWSLAWLELGAACCVWQSCRYVLKADALCSWGLADAGDSVLATGCRAAGGHPAGCQGAVRGGHAGRHGIPACVQVIPHKLHTMIPPFPTHGYVRCPTRGMACKWQCTWKLVWCWQKCGCVGMGDVMLNAVPARECAEVCKPFAHPCGWPDCGSALAATLRLVPPVARRVQGLCPLSERAATVLCTEQ